MKRLIILRGLSGAGKSTLAARLGGVVLSSSDYFMAGNVYLFQGDEVPKSHVWNENRCLKLMRTGAPRIIIDNTNIRHADYERYTDCGRNYGYTPSIMMPTTAWAWDPLECFKHNVHNVPLENIERMLAEWEP